MRLVHLGGLPAQRVPVRLRGGAQVGGIEVAALVEYFAEPHGHGRPCRAADIEARPAGEILAEVEQHFTRRRAPDGDRAELADATHRWRQRSHERRRWRIEEGNRGPCVIVVRRARPAVQLTARVIRFPAVDIRRENGTRCGLPAGIRYDALRTPALIADFELSAQAKPPAVEIALAEEPELSAIPPIAQHCADRIVARSHERGDVIRLVLQPPAVRGPAGREQLVADALAVEIDLVEAEAGDVETRGTHAIGDAKGAPQQRRGRWKAIRGGRRWSDPLRGPVRRLQQSRFPKRDWTPRRRAAARIPDAHAPVVSRARHRGGVPDTPPIPPGRGGRAR